MTTLAYIQKYKIVTIIRGLSIQQTLECAQAMYRGGLRLAEVTFDQNGSDTLTGETIATLYKTFGDNMRVGAGTVMTLEQLHIAKEAGAAFIISPNTDVEIIRETKRLGMVSMPGAFTASEAAVCHAAGADIVKIFPSDSVGPAYFKALRGPLAHIAFAAVGGVNLQNISDFFAAGVCCVGIGANIVDKHAVAKGDYDAIENLARQYARSVENLG